MPFTYPPLAHVRKHGPAGYANYASYRPWLRDEFSFRCVYCLLRERWVTGGFHLDHFLPVSRHPSSSTEYDNLVYACSTCNDMKRDLELPDPTKALTSSAVTVTADGSITANTPEAKRLIRALDLNGLAYREFRLLWIDVLALAAQRNHDLFRRLLAYPDDLPDLSVLRPPGGNSRPSGISESAFEQRKAGTLVDTY